ncbi:hypothetical protein [Streptomyces flavidovirens]|uniref:hypothetical protein n=1 Tax=Streptomyces flavidovirens TaxID=67298 RepID=UPI000426DE0F|nr:hypothetical protein [Streptomyces flavidovirens]
MHTTEQGHLTTVIRHWTDLQDALGAPAKVQGFGVGLRSYLAALDRIDEQQAEADRQTALDRRLLERDPSQIGERPTPVRIAIFDTMQAIHADLLECADATAAAAQRPPMGPLPATYPEADRARRAVLAMRDAHDPRRWKWNGPRPSAPLTALWLLGRVQGAPGPFHRLTTRQTDYIASVARTAADRVEKALDIAAQLAPIAQPCPELRNLVPCGGRIEVHGGAGASPLAHCVRCGRIWSEQGIAA